MLVLGSTIHVRHNADYAHVKSMVALVYERLLLSVLNLFVIISILHGRAELEAKPTFLFAAPLAVVQHIIRPTLFFLLALQCARTATAETFAPVREFLELAALPSR